jgi:hypothetical protein
MTRKNWHYHYHLEQKSTMKDNIVKAEYFVDLDDEIDYCLSCLLSLLFLYANLLMIEGSLLLTKSNEKNHHLVLHVL